MQQKVHHGFRTNMTTSSRSYTAQVHNFIYGALDSSLVLPHYHSIMLLVLNLSFICSPAHDCPNGFEDWRDERGYAGSGSKESDSS